MTLTAWAISFAEEEWLIVLDMVNLFSAWFYNVSYYAIGNTDLTIPPAAQIACVAII